jgi:hypothetical protein
MSKQISVRARLSKAIKVTALIAALAFATVVVERPTMSTASAGSSAEQSLYWSDLGGAAMANPLPEPAAASESQSPTYFPSQFAPPSGEIESLPPTN